MSSGDRHWAANWEEKAIDDTGSNSKMFPAQLRRETSMLVTPVRCAKCSDECGSTGFMGWQAARGEVKSCVLGHRVSKGWRQESSPLSVAMKCVYLLTY